MTTWRRELEEAIANLHLLEDNLYSEIADLRAEVERLRAALGRLMRQPTMNPLDMTPAQRQELWAAHNQARRALAGEERA